jgi:hypothetical protein
MARQTITHDLGGTTVEITSLPPRAALRLLGRLARVLGPLLAECFSIGGIRDTRGGVIPWQAIESHPEALDEIMRQAIDHLARLDPDDLGEIAADLLCGACKVGPVAIPARTRDGAEAVIDEVFPDVWTLIGAVRLALDVNFRPTSAAAPGGG